MKSFVLMLQFLTHIPLPFELEVTEEDFAKGIYFFTAVGMVLGAILALAYFLLQNFFTPLTLAVFLVFLHIVDTGALHLDGLADTADGLFSNRSAEKILEIMHDSRIGSNGVVALIFVIGLKVVFVYELLLRGAWLYLLVVPILGRFASVFTSFLGKSPLEHGMGNLFIGHVSPKQLVFNVLLILPFLFFLPLSIAALLAIAAYLYFLVRACTKIIGGVTGDILGFACETAEVLALFTIAILLK